MVRQPGSHEPAAGSTRSTTRSQLVQAKSPVFVGYAWFVYYDQAVTMKPGATEAFNMGLVNHDEVDRSSTLVFAVAPEPRATWFARSGQFAAVNPSWAFHDEFELARGQTMTWCYRLVVADGAWDRDTVERHFKERPW